VVLVFVLLVVVVTVILGVAMVLVSEDTSKTGSKLGRTIKDKNLNINF
jgi:hypothetical protein